MQNPPNNPQWVTNFCCTAPYVALLIIALGLVVGSEIAVPIFGGMLWLCGKTTQLLIGTAQ